MWPGGPQEVIASRNAVVVGRQIAEHFCATRTLYQFSAGRGLSLVLGGAARRSPEIGDGREAGRDELVSWVVSL